jgi:hypothetical protein
VLAELSASQDFDSRWCNGMLVLAWQRPPGWTSRAGLALAWRRVAHFGLLAPSRRLAWRVLGPRPRLMALARRIYLHGGTTVPERP